LALNKKRQLNTLITGPGNIFQYVSSGNNYKYKLSLLGKRYYIRIEKDNKSRDKKLFEVLSKI